MLTWNIIILILFSINHGGHILSSYEGDEVQHIIERQHKESSGTCTQIRKECEGYLVWAGSRLISWGWWGCRLPAGSGFLGASLWAACSQRALWWWRCWPPVRPAPLGCWSGSLSPGLWTCSPTEEQTSNRECMVSGKEHDEQIKSS